MKYLASSILAAMIVTAGVFAGDESTYHDEYTPEFSAVIDYDFNLEVESEGGKVTFSWDEFSKSNFKWWKLAYSQDGSTDIAYPESKNRFLGDDEDLDESEQWFNTGNYNFRLCAITHDNKRYCGKVVSHSVEKMSKEKIYKEYKWKEKKFKKKVEHLKKHLEKQKYILAQKLKFKINHVISQFIKKLESKNYNDEKIVEKIESVQEKLKSYMNKEKYKHIAGYINEVLEIKKQKFQNDSLGELEDMFKDF